MVMMQVEMMMMQVEMVMMQVEMVMVMMQVEMAFSKFDSSGDDRLDYREFCAMINKKTEEEEAARK